MHIRCVVVAAGIVGLALTAAPTAGAQPAPDDDIRDYPDCARPIHHTRRLLLRLLQDSGRPVVRNRPERRPGRMRRRACRRATGHQPDDRQQLGARGVPPLGHRDLHPRRRRPTRGVPPGELGCDLRGRRRGRWCAARPTTSTGSFWPPATASSGSGSAPRRSPASPGCRRGWPGRCRGRSRAACAPVRVRCCGSRTAPSSRRGRRPGSTRARRWCGRRRHRFARPARVAVASVSVGGSWVSDTSSATNSRSGNSDSC